MGKYLKITLSDFLKEDLTNVLSDEFMSWFRDSKVTNDKGTPLEVYHGSSEMFNIFKGDAYFTDDYMNADGYASGEYVYDVYLRIENPLIVDCGERKWDDLDTPYGSSTQDVVTNVNRAVHDGVIFKNVKDNWIDDVDYQDPSTVYVTFHPNQIKSVDNDGTWDTNDDNIHS